MGQSGQNPLDHLAQYGAQEWRNPGPNFDSAFYAEINPSFIESSLSPLEHYLSFGQAAGIPGCQRQMYETSEFGALLTQSALLDADWYLTRYPDVRKAGLSALEHHVMIGAREWRNPGPRFEPALYVESSPDFPTDGSISPLEHYLRACKANCYLTENPLPYDRWRGQFDILTPLDRRRIEADVQSRPSAIVALVYIGPSNGAAAETIFGSVEEQIGLIASHKLAVDGTSLDNVTRFYSRSSE